MSVLRVFLLLTVCAHSIHGQPLRVHVNDCGGTIVAGQNCTLLCSVSGVSSSNLATTSYQWTKNNGTAEIQVGNNYSSMLVFSSLRLSDAGRYTCQVTVGSEMFGYSEYINIHIPAPVSINITSVPTNPIRPIGTANVTLTCTVELSKAIDVPVTVNIMWSGPDGMSSRTTSTSQPVMGSPTTTYTSTAIVRSFGRNQSGNYTCGATLTSSSLFLSNSRQHSKSAYVTVGLYFSLRNTTYANNSVIFVSKIGEDSTWPPVRPLHSLQCITDKRDCCQQPWRSGEWYFPNASWVPRRGYFGSTFYRTRGNDGSVNLNRRDRDLALIETGLFCCVVPDAMDNDQTLCANIVHVTINSHGVNTAGDWYALECTVGGMTEAVTYQWLDWEGSPIISGSSMFIGYTVTYSYIEFFSLHQSHEGNYTCNASTTDATESVSFNVSVNVPSISAQIRVGGALPVVGLGHTLICDVLGASNLIGTIIYLWVKNSSQILANSSTRTLSLHSLRLSDAGEYTCRVTVRSPYLRKEITAMTSHSLVLDLPAPTSIIIRSSKPNPIRPVGSDVNVTCTAVLSPAVDVPVTVDIQLSDPAGRTLTTTTPSISGSNYTTSAMVSSFGRNQSGNYTCTVNTSSTLASSFIAGSKIKFETLRITAGMYLSLKGEVYANNSFVTVTEIGEGGNSMKCITDRMHCCRRYDRLGEWYFPNGSSVPIPYAATSFYRLRSDGYIYLNRLNSNITDPIGQFCCVLPDATNVYQTLCINLVPPVSVRIVNDANTPTAGQRYSLACNVAGVENLHSVITYRWIKSNGTETHHAVGTNSNTLSFSSLRLSDAGNYTCEVMVNSHLLHNAVNGTSKQFEIQLPVPQPIVRLVADTPNPILSGSSPTLTCAVEFSPAVDVPASVSTVWTGPDGLTLTSAAPPVMKTFTHYVSKAKLNYVESADSGNYSCTVSIGGKIRASVGKTVVIGGGMFQIRLKNADTCQPWYKSAHADMEAELYKYHIEEAIVEAIESRCECHFPRANLLQPLFSCASSPNLTTYRNTLIGTHNFNATQLIGFVQDWVTSAPQINIKDYSVWLDSSCPVAIASLKEPECGEVRQCPCANDPNVVKCMEHLGNENFAECINTCI